MLVDPTTSWPSATGPGVCFEQPAAGIGLVLAARQRVRVLTGFGRSRRVAAVEDPAVLGESFFMEGGDFVGQIGGVHLDDGEPAAARKLDRSRKRWGKAVLDQIRGFGRES
jgi:hypothetical protein